MPLDREVRSQDPEVRMARAYARSVSGWAVPASQTDRVCNRGGMAALRDFEVDVKPFQKSCSRLPLGLAASRTPTDIRS